MSIIEIIIITLICLYYVTVQNGANPGFHWCTQFCSSLCEKEPIRNKVCHTLHHTEISMDSKTGPTQIEWGLMKMIIMSCIWEGIIPSRISHLDIAQLERTWILSGEQGAHELTVHLCSKKPTWSLEHIRTSKIKDKKCHYFTLIGIC